MSLQFSRVGYDKYNIQEDERVNNRIENYMHERYAHEIQNSCYSPFGSGPSDNMVSRPMTDGFLNLGNKADIESKLRNIHIPLNDQENKNNKDYMSIQRTDEKPCGIETMTNEDSRFTHPIQNYREMSTTHLVFNPYLPVNPQNVVAETPDFNSWEERIGESTRNQVKSYSNNYLINKKKVNLNRKWETKFQTLLPKNALEIASGANQNKQDIRKAFLAN